jgi:predicted aspartyl protease
VAPGRSQATSAYLKMIVDNRPVQCLIDSGSEASILPSKYVRQESIQRTNNSLRAANGSNIPVLGEAVVPIRVGGFRSDIKAIISDHIPEPMIGNDWLRDVGAVLDFGGNHLMLNGYCSRRCSQDGSAES